MPYKVYIILVRINKSNKTNNTAKQLSSVLWWASGWYYNIFTIAGYSQIVRIIATTTILILYDVALPGTY